MAGKSAPRLPRELTECGQAKDGRPIFPGDVFLILSGRLTTPYPKQKSEKYASWWLIENAVAEARARGDSFNARGFGAVQALRTGELAQSDRDGMLMYLFGQQPVVPRSLMWDDGLVRY
ncbi:hypothetical protein [Castellaniella sp.]|uniref:hypothetical protein n=1 Tax=Castellaniella sp. TaxID=1955812 RepID=UPI002AFE2DB8|nr:hypothetical protein [Castellaniella sp.]